MSGILPASGRCRGYVNPCFSYLIVTLKVMFFQYSFFNNGKFYENNTLLLAENAMKQDCLYDEEQDPQTRNDIKRRKLKLM